MYLFTNNLHFSFIKVAKNVSKATVQYIVTNVAKISIIISIFITDDNNKCFFELQISIL